MKMWMLSMAVATAILCSALIVFVAYDVLIARG